MEPYEVHMIYALTPEQHDRIVEQGGDLPAVRVVHEAAVSRLKTEGFVVCDADGVPLEDQDQEDPVELEPAVVGITPGVVPVVVDESGDLPGEGDGQ